MDLEYLKMSAPGKFWYNFKNFFRRLPSSVAAFFKAIPKKLYKLWLAFAAVFINIGRAAKEGDWKTRTSFGIMGFGMLARKQYLRGILYLVFEVLFILYMALFGWKYLAKMGSLGEVAMVEVIDPITEVPKYEFYDNSLLILLYSLLTVFIMAAFVYMWYQNVKGNFLSQQFVEARLALPTTKDDLRSYADENYHKTLLSIPVLGLVVFTILPIFFMIFIAFTNYDKLHQPPKELFQWVGFDNFVTVLGGGISSDSKVFAVTFGAVLLWTVIWAIFATFTNYILGMIVAIMINKKGVRFKKFWRTVLIMTIAVPQFVSLLFMSQLLDDQGLINNLLLKWGWIDKAIPFLTDGMMAKVTVIVVNIWVGIPYSMLICTGILMNIPEDLYESARMDGAGPVRAYMRITLPYMLHVTTPYLITQFIGNLNNFNMIYFLTVGTPLLNVNGATSTAGSADLLITWLYKLTKDNGEYAVASVIGIFTFIVVAVLSLILYNRSKSVKNEEDFM